MHLQLLTFDSWYTEINYYYYFLLLFVTLAAKVGLFIFHLVAIQWNLCSKSKSCNWILSNCVWSLIPTGTLISVFEEIRCIIDNNNIFTKDLLRNVRFLKECEGFSDEQIYILSNSASTTKTRHFQSSLTHTGKLNINHLPPPPSPVQTLWEHFPKSLLVAIDWRRYVVSVAARAGSAALFGYLCLRRNEFQLEYQSQCALSYTHAHAEFQSHSVGLIWVYLFLKKANSGAMCTVLQRNSLHFNTLFFFRSSERMFPLADAGAAHYTLCLRLNLFFFFSFPLKQKQSITARRNAILLLLFFFL